jgi:AcrR family transcriptional regulator
MPNKRIPQDNSTYERILDVVGELFAAHGYQAVTLRMIGDALDMTHASLYYYAPNGKKQLFLDVTERNLTRQRDGITHAISSAGDDVREQLRAVGRWLFSQPPMDMSFLIRVDAAVLGETEAARLSELADHSLRQPLVAALQRARDREQITLRNLDMGVLAFMTLVEVVHRVPSGMNTAQTDAYLDELIEMLMLGWAARQP